MLVSLLTVAVLVSPTAGDTVISFGRVSRDLTGDSVPEVLTLVGRGKSIDQLDVTFTITSANRESFIATFQLKRSDFDYGRPASDADFKARLAEYGDSFFDPRKFETPAEFVAKLRTAAPEHIDLIPRVIAGDRADHDMAQATATWKEMQGVGITIFEFSVGGDAVTSIGWSAKDERFVHLWECC